MIKIFNKETTLSPLFIALTYALIATIWVLITDMLVEPQESTYPFFQTFKGMFFIAVTTFLVFLLTNRSLKIQKHLNSVLTVLSDINQLIVREKDVKRLLQQSCDILTSSHIYNNAWIMTLDKQKRVNGLIYSGDFKEALLFKEKIKTDWTPHCVSKVQHSCESYSFVKSTLKECSSCPLANFKNFKSAFTIEIKHKDELYGYLNISMQTEYLDDKKELALLKELAGDISYALNNIKMEKELAESNRQLVSFMDNLPGMAYRCKNDDKWSMEFISQRCFDLTGYNAVDITNNNKISFLKIIHPDDRVSSRNDVDNGLKKRGAFESEYRIITASKEVKWVWEHGIGIYDKDNNIIALEGVILDNDARKYAEEELIVSNRLLEQKSKELETIFNEAPDPMAIHDEDGNVLMINKALEEKTGYSFEEIETIDKWFTKVAPTALGERKEYIKNLYLIEQKTDEGEFEITTKSGEVLIWSFSSGPLKTTEDGKRVLITSAKDITELKRKDELILMQSRHAAMGEMIGMIAHQWRQPISIIAMVANNMLLDIALENFDSKEAEKLSHSILEQTSHLSKTIDDFRNFFKSDKEISKVKLHNIIEETLAIVGDSIENNSIEIQTSFNSEAEVEVYPRELMQVFINIINNAKDAILINNIEKPMIKIKLYEDEKYAISEICDNAKGIDVAIMAKIFDPYFTTRDEKIGTGLGLYMSKIIVEKHLRGTIEAFNSDQGACFRVRLIK